MFEKLKGKRTIIQGILFSLMGLIFGLDSLIHDNLETLDVIETGWISMKTYIAIGAMLGGGSIITGRLAVPKN